MIDLENLLRTVPRWTVRSAMMAGLAALSIAPPAVSARTVEIAFNADNFSDPLTIDNKYLPLVEGTTFVYKAETSEGCVVNRVTVTYATQVVADVTTRVVEDIAYIDEECDGTLVKEEETFDWFAQDDAGNIWYFGEDSKDCVDNVCTRNDGSWEAGVDGAVAGIIMLKNPRPGDKYLQEFYEDHAEDEAAVLRVDAWVSLYREDAYLPADFHNCLKTKEWTTLEQGFIEQKFYCPEIGLVAVDEHHGKSVRLELVEVTPP